MDFSTIPHAREARLLYDPTTIAWQENYILLSQYPKEESRLTAVIRPFDYIVRQ